MDIDDYSWMDEVPSKLTLRENTVYFFNPALDFNTEKQILLDMISDDEPIKHGFLSRVGRDGDVTGLVYFSVGSHRHKIQGWWGDGGFSRSGTENIEAALNKIEETYIKLNYQVIDMRKELSGLIKESEEDDGLDWIRDVKPSIVDMFVPGKKYMMGKLFSIDILTTYTYSHMDHNYKAMSYEDGRGALIFNGAYYTPLYIETKMKQHNLTIKDLVV